MSRYNQLKKLAVFDLKMAKKAGVSQPTISRLLSRGILVRVERGFYMHSEADVQYDELDYIVACLKFGSKSFISGLTALVYYNLVEQIPTQVWVSVPEETRTTNSKYKLLRLKKIDHFGVQESKHFRIAGIERALVDALHFSSKIGERIAIAATVRAIRDRKSKLELIMKMARELKVDKKISKYWESIIGNIESEL
jgi:predicted transcriptional regulator of viral defense system